MGVEPFWGVCIRHRGWDSSWRDHLDRYFLESLRSSQRSQASLCYRIRFWFMSRAGWTLLTKKFSHKKGLVKQQLFACFHNRQWLQYSLKVKSRERNYLCLISILIKQPNVHFPQASCIFLSSSLFLLVGREVKSREEKWQKEGGNKERGPQNLRGLVLKK